MCDVVHRGDTKTLKKFLENGANVNVRDYDGRCALHIAAADGNLEAVNMLLEHGAIPNTKDRYQMTPLMEALFSESTAGFAIVTVLLKADAKPLLPEGISSEMLCFSVKDGANQVERGNIYIYIYIYQEGGGKCNPSLFYLSLSLPPFFCSAYWLN